MQNRKGDKDIQNRLLDSVGQGEGGIFWKNSMYIIYSETGHKPRLDAWNKFPGPGALGRTRGIGWGGRWEGASGWGIHVTPWLIHVNVWQNPIQYCKVISLQLIKIFEKKITIDWARDLLPTWRIVLEWKRLCGRLKILNNLYRTANSN